MSRTRRTLPLVGVVAGLLVAAVLMGRPDEPGPALDPRSTAPLGTAALVETLRALGARVDVTADIPEATEPVVLVLADALDPAQHDALREWVGRGGRVVVTDPRSPLAATLSGEGALFGGGTLAPECPADALRQVSQVRAPGAVALQAPDGALACFPIAGGHWLVATDEGDGTVVSLGGPEVWTNRRIGAADNALLAAALLAPAPGDVVVVLEPARPGEGDATLADVLDPRVPAALLQALLAFLAFAVWRARRLGPPPAEPRAVEIPAAELVVAAGNLYAQAGARERAADHLREELRDLARWRADAADEVDALLRRPPPADDRSLTTFAQDVERLRRTLQGADRAP